MPTNLSLTNRLMAIGVLDSLLRRPHPSTRRDREISLPPTKPGNRTTRLKEGEHIDNSKATPTSRINVRGRTKKTGIEANQERDGSHYFILTALSIVRKITIQMSCIINHLQQTQGIREVINT